MMQFRVVRDSLINRVLGPAAACRFVTVGFQRQSKAADEILDDSRTVQVYYSSSRFPKGAGSLRGPVQNKVTFRIDLSVSKAAEGDLSVITGLASTPSQIKAALSAFQEASDLADQSLDELIEIVYQILMSASNVDLGLAAGEVADRWVDNIEKDTPVSKGDLVVLTASMMLTFGVAEDLTGDEGTAGTTFGTVVDIDGDDVEKTGITTTNV